MKIRVSEKLDDLQSLVSQMKSSSNEIGALAIFVGVVRGTRRNEKVTKIEYEAYESLAPKAIEKIIEELRTKYGIIDVVVEHRVGTIPVGGDVMYVLIASKHREEGFQALTEMINRIKHEVPVWKKEVTAEGAYWVENP